MIHASLFSGIGGPEVAAAMLGWGNAFHCEINPFGKAVLEYWFPDSKSYDDITKASFKEWRGRIDVLTGGFPCQPFSYAGKRGGRNDDRYLWPEMLRVIDEVRPAWVVGENVAGITTMVEGGLLSDMGCDPSMFGEGDGFHRYQLRERFTIERICADLEGLGYAVQPLLIPAAAVGAPHRRDRVFIVAHDADADGRDAVRGPGIVPRSRGTERLQERHEVRQFGVADNVRPQVPGDAENSDCAGCAVGDEKVERSKRIIRDAGAGNDEWICGEARTDSADSNIHRGNKVDEYIQPKIADGAVPVRDGRERDATHSCIKGLERKNESGDSEGRERMHLRRDTPGYDWKSLRPGERWASFPVVSPVHRGNDGLPFPLDDLTIPATKWRTESLKAYGNAIVPQVMFRIFQAIETASIL